MAQLKVFTRKLKSQGRAVKINNRKFNH
jgi:hypothetical protein